MREPESTTVLLIARAQAWFEAFVVTDSLPAIKPQWIDEISLKPEPGVFVRAWIGKGPLQHSLGKSVTLYFEHGEQDYPVLQHPSTGPSNAALMAKSSDRLLLADEATAIFGVEVIVVVPAPAEWFDRMSDQGQIDAEAQFALNSATSSLDTLVGSFALYQYPLIWRPIDNRRLYLLVDTDGPRATRHREPLPADNFIPFKLDPSKRLVNGELRDGLTNQVGSLLRLAAGAPLVFLKDSMWHSDIRTRFLLQFWILEYFSEEHARRLPPDDHVRQFVRRLEDLVKVHSPDDLARFRAKKGELMRRTLAEKVRACFDYFKIQYDDSLFKRAKRVRDALSHGSAYEQRDLIEMEHYVREVSRYVIQRDLEFKGLFLKPSAEDPAALPVIVPKFTLRESADEQTMRIGPI